MQTFWGTESEKYVFLYVISMCVFIKFGLFHQTYITSFPEDQCLISTYEEVSKIFLSSQMVTNTILLKQTDTDLVGE